MDQKKSDGEVDMGIMWSATSLDQEVSSLRILSPNPFSVNHKSA